MLRQGTDSFNSPPNKVMLRIFISLKNVSPSAVINPRIFDPTACTLSTRPPTATKIFSNCSRSLDRHSNSGLQPAPAISMYARIYLSSNKQNILSMEATLTPFNLGFRVAICISKTQTTVTFFTSVRT
jgi:hypothetical protein